MMNNGIQNSASRTNSAFQTDRSANHQSVHKDSSHTQMALELERLHELRRQVAAQEQKLQSLRQQAANSGSSRNLLAAEEGVIKSLIFTKEKELALALMKVAELTSQLEQLRRNQPDDTKLPLQRGIEPSQMTMCDMEQQQRGAEPVQKVIPIKVIRESVYTNHDSRRCADVQSKSDAERGVRIIPIMVERTFAVPVGHDKERLSMARNGDEKTSLGQNVFPSVPTEMSIVQQSSYSDIDSFSSTSSKAASNKESYFDSEKSESSRSLPSQSMNNVNGASNDKIPKTESLSCLNYSNDSSFTGNKSCDKKVEGSIALTGKVTRDGTGKSELANGKLDGSRSKCPTTDKKDIRNSRSFCDDSKDDNKRTTFTHDKKSASDFSLSTQLGIPTKEYPTNMIFIDSSKTAEIVTIPCVSSSSLCSAELTDSGRFQDFGIRSDRARFFMDMVKEVDAREGGGATAQPLLISTKNRESTEVKYPISSAGLTTTSRGRSSSSAIMSRFAPQPYGRSKSVDSGNMRTPLTTSTMQEHSPLHGLSGVKESLEPTDNCDIKAAESSYNYLSVTDSMQQNDVSLMNDSAETKNSITSTKPNDFSSTLGKLLTVSEPPQSTVSSTGLECSLQKVEYKTVVDGTTLGKKMPDSKVSLPTAASSLASGTSISSGKTVRGDTMPQTGGEGIVNMLQKLSTSEAMVSASLEGKEIKTAQISKSPCLSGKMDAAAASVNENVPDGHIQSTLQTAAATSAQSSSKSTLAQDTNILGCSRQTVNGRLSTSLSQVAPSVSETFSTSEVLTKSITGTDFAKSTSTTFSTYKGMSTSSNSKASTKQIQVTSKQEDIQSAEELGDSSWDSNVKRLAHIYAVTIGDTVKGRINFQGSKKRGLHDAVHSDGISLVPSTSCGAHKVMGSATNRPEHSKSTQQDLESGKMYVKSSFQNVSVDDHDRSSVDKSQRSGISADQTHSTDSFTSESSDFRASSEADFLEQSKIDTSADSVSTALSVLLKGTSSLHSSPVRPNRLYGHALRSTISSAYRRKLGSGAMDNYSQNMTLLYGDHRSKRDDSSSSQTSESTDSVLSTPLSETPLIEDLPHILALDTLDGMPFYPRITSHLICCENQGSVSYAAADNGSTLEQFDNKLKTGDVELTVIRNPIQMANLVHLDSADTKAQSSRSFSPSDEIVSAYIDDPATADQDRFVSETTTGSLSQRSWKRKGRSQRRVTFDHVSLLLNAALEGEKDLVIDIVNKIANPNHKTENGLTALHNAVCGNHIDVVRYLVGFGCDINATDNDGWTPLHCASSSNSKELMRLLVENGASIFPLTVFDRETPVQKCSRNLPGYEEASKYLNDVAKSLGVENDGYVYATSNFSNVCSDELVLHDGDRLKILRRGDKSETEWWWARHDNGGEGYVPQSLLALRPRIAPKQVK